MKKLFTLFVTLSFALVMLGQSPQKMTYQAVIRNTSDALVTSGTVGMQISIIQGSENGTAVYVETKTTTTNANGLVTIEIGGGTPVLGSFASIDWSTGPYFIKIETAIAAPFTTYTITGISQLLSVPYALLAETTTGSAASFTGSLIGDVTGTQNATVIGNAAVISKVLTGFSSASGTITASDNILQAIQKLNGNDAINADLVGDVTSSGNTTTIANKVTMTANLPVSISGSPTVIASSPVSISIAPATGSSAGTMSAADKTKLDNMTPNSYYLGEVKDGGIIFNLYKGSDGQEHGLIVALVEATGKKWQENDITQVNANRTWDGVYNTGLMENDSEAKTYVQSLGAGWYLPSIDELNLLWNNRFYVNSALSSGGYTLLKLIFYWSSTEYTAGEALYINFVTGAIGTNGLKTNLANVRAIRSF